jgi:hypothetical protein
VVTLHTISAVLVWLTPKLSSFSQGDPISSPLLGVVSSAPTTNLVGTFLSEQISHAAPRVAALAKLEILALIPPFSYFPPTPMVEFGTAPSPPSQPSASHFCQRTSHTSPRPSNALAGSHKCGRPSGRYHEVKVGLLLTAGRCASRAEAWDGLKGKIHTCGQTRSTYRNPPECFFASLVSPGSTHTSPQTRLRPFCAVPTRFRRHQSMPAPAIWGRVQWPSSGLLVVTARNKAGSLPDIRYRSFSGFPIHGLLHLGSESGRRQTRRRLWNHGDTWSYFMAQSMIQS